METLSFKKKFPQARSAFQSLYLPQNLQVIKVCCLIFFPLGVAIRLFIVLHLSDTTKFPHYQEYNFVNWMYLAVLPIFYLISRILIRQYRHHTKPLEKLVRIFNISFGIFFMICGMLISFIAMHNPHNSLTLFLAALIVVSVILVFEVRETLILIIIVQLAFFLMLKLNNPNNDDFFYNMAACATLLTGFVFMSRYIYIYKAKNFIQLLKIEEINSELRNAGVFKNEVLGMVAYDLRNPLAAIESLASLIQMDEHDEETVENISMIQASCIKARAIINDLLEAARDEGDEELVMENCNMNHLLENVVKQWKNHGLENPINLISSEKPVYAQLNLEKFNRVLDNLISNAIKFSHTSGKIDVCLTESKKQINIEIKDYGIGIPQHLLPHIFDRFSKSSRKGLRGEKSVGLGLNISKRIVEKHKGTLVVESVENHGSVFRISLPKADASFIG